MFIAYNELQLQYGKVYSEFEDKFRKTIYFINKEMIKAHNKLYEVGLDMMKMGISKFTDGTPTTMNHRTNVKHRKFYPNRSNQEYGYGNIVPDFFNRKEYRVHLVFSF